jgi:quinoprotein glucose dehydrogenase
VTAGGLVFIAASFDDRLRAFDTDSGALVWEVKLPAGGQATPMTYAIGGRQYVVIAAGGYKEDSTRGDFLVAYALPR